jgi:hypothetical protein
MMIKISPCHGNTGIRSLVTKAPSTAPIRKIVPSQQLRIPFQQQQRLYSRTTAVQYKFPDDEDAERIIIPGQPDIQQVGFDGLSDEELERMIDEQIEIERQEEAEKFVPNWRPGMRKRPLQMHYRLEEFEYELEPEKHEPVSYIYVSYSKLYFQNNLLTGL